MRFQGFVTPAQAAERLRICRRTALAWAHRSLNNDEDAPFKDVEQTPTGRILIPLREVERLSATARSKRSGGQQ